MELILDYFKHNERLPIESFIYDKEFDKLYILSAYALYKIIVTDVAVRFSEILNVGNENYLLKDEVKKLFWKTDELRTFASKYILNENEVIEIMAKIIRTDKG